MLVFLESVIHKGTGGQIKDGFLFTYKEHKKPRLDFGMNTKLFKKAYFIPSFIWQLDFDFVFILSFATLLYHAV